MIHQTSDLILTHAASPIRLADFRREFLALYEPPLGSKATRDKYRQVLDLVDGLGVAATDGLTPELVAKFIAGRPAGQSPHTTRSLLMALRAICGYAEGRRYLIISPFRLRKLSRWIRVSPPTGKRHQSAAEIRRLLDTLAGDVEVKRGWAQWRARRLHAAVAAVAYTGIRKMECLRLFVEDVDIEGGLIHVRPRRARAADDGPTATLKTEGSAAAVAMPAALRPILADWLAHRLDHPDGFPMPPASSIPWVFPGSRRVGAWTGGAPGCKPIHRLQAAAGRAGIEAVTWQSLRRSWATIAEAAGVPQALITRQCRHADAETTRRWYQQRDLDALKGAVEGFDF
jgi:integrase